MQQVAISELPANTALWSSIAAQDAVSEGLNWQNNSDGCSRGELLLNDAELSIVSQILGEFSHEWRFDRILPAAAPPPLKSIKAASFTNRTQTTRTAGTETRAKRSEGSTEPTAKKARLPDSTYGDDAVDSMQHQEEMNTEGKTASLTSKASLQSNENLQTASTSNLISSEHSTASVKSSSSQTYVPDSNAVDTPIKWSTVIHDVLIELLKHPPSQMMANLTAASDSDAHQRGGATSSTRPTGLQDIIEKLDAEYYMSHYDALKDVFSVFVRSFGLNDPGSPDWMNTQDTAHRFEELMHSYSQNGDSTASKLIEKNDAYDVMMKEYSNEIQVKGEDPSSWLDWRKQQFDSSCVDETLQALLAKGREKKKKVSSVNQSNIGAPQGSSFVQDGWTGGSNGKSKTKKNTKKKMKDGGASHGNRKSMASIDMKENKADAQILDRERAEFQSLLLQLQQDQHYDLFTEFQDKAVWRTLEGGEVELNDRGTSPRVFRSMVAWCRRKLTGSHGQPPHYDATQRDGIPQEYDDAGGYNDIRKNRGIGSSYKPNNDSADSSSASSSGESDRG